MRQFAVWNAERDLWEVDQIDLLSGLSDAFSETWPRSGMTRAGTAYAQPTSEHRTDDSESSSLPLLPTPMAQEPGGTAEQYRDRWAKSDGRTSTFLPLSMAISCLSHEPPTAARADLGSEAAAAT